MAIYNNIVKQITQTVNPAPQTTLETFTSGVSTVIKRIVLSYYGSATIEFKLGFSYSPVGTSPIFIATYTDADFTTNKSIDVVFTPIYAVTENVNIGSIVIETTAPLGETFNYVISYMELPSTSIVSTNTTSGFASVVLSASGSEQTAGLYTNSGVIPFLIKNVYFNTNVSSFTSGEYLKFEVSAGTPTTSAPITTANLSADVINSSIFAKAENGNNLVVMPGQAFQITASPLANPVTFSYLLSGSAVS